MNYRLLFFLLLLLLLGCTGCSSDIPPATTQETQAVIATQPVETTEATQPPRVYTTPTLPTAWQANCDEYLYLRKEPRVSQILQTLKPGDPITLLGWDGIYAHVRSGDTEGYVLSQYIKPAEALWSALQVVSPTATYTYDQMTYDINRLCGLYPESCSQTVIGASELGKEIPALLIGNPNAKNHVLLHGGIHGREHMTSWLLMAMADCWLSNNLDLMSDVCYHLIPMVNPDGVAISQTETLSETQTEIYQRDRARKYTSDSKTKYARLWKANGLGVDLNRSFSAGWEYLNGPTSPSSQRYAGTEPFSAAEAKALRDYTLRYPFGATVSYHAYGSIIYYEYGNRQPANDQSLELALVANTVTGYRPEGSLGVQGGGYKDWAIQELGIPSLTIEIGCQKTPLPERELYSIFYRNLSLLPAIAQWLTQQ